MLRWRHRNQNLLQQKINERPKPSTATTQSARAEIGTNLQFIQSRCVIASAWEETSVLCLSQVVVNEAVCDFHVGNLRNDPTNHLVAASVVLPLPDITDMLLTRRGWNPVQRRRFRLQPATMASRLSTVATSGYECSGGLGKKDCSSCFRSSSWKYCRAWKNKEFPKSFRFLARSNHHGAAFVT